MGADTFSDRLRAGPRARLDPRKDKRTARRQATIGDQSKHVHPKSGRIGTPPFLQKCSEIVLEYSRPVYPPAYRLTFRPRPGERSHPPRWSPGREVEIADLIALLTENNPGQTEPIPLELSNEPLEGSNASLDMSNGPLEGFNASLDVSNGKTTRPSSWICRSRSGISGPLDELHGSKTRTGTTGRARLGAHARLAR